MLQRLSSRLRLLLPAAAASGAPRQQLHGAAAAASSSSPGLFGLARLQAPQDFPRWAQDAIARCNELVALALAAPPDAAVVALLDELSDEMCQVYDSAECCRNVHADVQWQRGATKACQLLGEYLAEINHHKGLYSKLLEVQQTHARTLAAAAAAGGQQQQAPAAAEAAGQQRQAAAAAAAAAGWQQQEQVQSAAGPAGAADVQLSGQPLLSPAQLAAFCPETVVVAAKFKQDFEKYGIHIRDPQQAGHVARLLALNQHYPADFNAALADARQLGSVSVPGRLLHPSMRPYASLGGGVTVPLDPGSVHHFLAATENEEARKQVYLAAGRTPASNLALLDDMLAARHQLGRLLGFPSYAAFKAADSTLAGNPAAAESFCGDLAAGCRQQADGELALLAQMKRRHTQDPSAVLQPWDQEFYSRQLAASQPATAAAAAAAPYLQLSSVLAGLSELLTQLMGLRLVQQPLPPGEAWAPGLLKFAVECRQEGRLGVLYLDLCGRPGKVPSSGILYPLRCGRQLPGGLYQQPILCLVCNLSASGGSSSSAGADPSGLLLTWREFRTLLHEAGHAVHSMVSRTRYQHVWGTRCSQDIVEVPSHLWEHFATDTRSLALLARHKGSSRQPLPPQLAQQLTQQASATPALELQQQALLSLVDLVYHGATSPASAGGTSAVWATLARQHASLPPPADVHPQARFSHLTIYGASYYSYLYARCLSEAIWTTHLAHDPLDPAAGERIKLLLLQPGGSKEPLDILTDTLGGAAGRDKVLQHRQGGWCPNPQALLSSIR